MKSMKVKESQKKGSFFEKKVQKTNSSVIAYYLLSKIASNTLVIERSGVQSTFI